MIPSPSELQAIAEREKKATPGPWEAWRRGNAPMESGKLVGQSMLKGPPSPYEPRAHAARDMRTVYMRDEDADFVAHARTDIPTLLEAVKELQAKLAKDEAIFGAHSEDWERLRDAVDATDSEGIADAIERLKGHLAATTATLNARETEFQDARSWRAQLHIATEALAAMSARCERLEGVIEQFIDSFKQVWMTSAMERAFNAGLEALRDEPTGGG